MCIKCAQDPEYRRKLQREFDAHREEILTETTTSFAKFLTAMEKHDDFETAQLSARLGGVFNSVSEILSLAHHEEFTVMMAKRVVEEHEKKEE